MIGFITGLFTDRVKAATTIALVVVVGVFVVSLVTYVNVITGQRDKAVNEIAQMKTDARTLKDQRTKEIAELRAKNSEAALRIATSYTETIERLRDYYANHPNVVYRHIADQLQQPATTNSGGGVSGVSIPAEVFAKGGGDQDPVFNRLASDCAETTAQYDALMNSWEAYCRNHQCEASE